MDIGKTAVTMKITTPMVRSMRYKYFLLSLLLLVMASTTHSEKMMRWVDKNGVVHYADQAPSNVSAEIIEIGSRRSTIPTTQTTTESTDATTAQSQPDRIMIGETAASIAIRQANCKRARANLKIFLQSLRIRSEDPISGEIRYLSEKEKAEETEKARQQVAQYCED